MAEIASQEGTALYKQGKLDKARELYLKAARLDKTEPKYLSNLSAVLYELGRYADCLAAIRQCWECLSAHGISDKGDLDSNPLALKLATRFAKAKISGVAANVISLHKNKSKTKDDKLKYERDMEAFVLNKTEGALLEDEKLREMRTAWEQWRAIREACATHSAEACKANVAAAASRLRELHIYKRAADPRVEFFKFGHDEFKTMLEGMNHNPKDAYALDVPELANREDFSFMFGGSGDARHVYTTLIHLFLMIMGDSKESMSVHITLIDIHPATLARFILVLGLLRDIILTHMVDDEQRRTELHTTLFYVYTAMLMPEYCRQIVMEIAGILAVEITQKMETLPPWLHIHEESIPAIVQHLRSWSEPLKKSTSVCIEKCIRRNSPDLSSLSLSEYSKGLFTDAELERAIFHRHKVALPPEMLLHHHPALQKMVKAFPKPSKSLYNALDKEIETTWQPNPTLFDLRNIECKDDADEFAYPLYADEPLKLREKIARYIDRKNQLEHDSSYAVCHRFFNMVAKSIDLFEDFFGHFNLTIEVIHGDATSCLPKLFAGDFGNRPPTFPKEYSRIFLSNVPDYTNGALNTAVQLVPYLEPRAIAMANCLLNPGGFENIDEYCYNYALLHAEDFPRFLGCKVIDPEKNLWHDIALQKLPLPRPLDQLASKQELHAWLEHLLLCTLCNGRARRQPYRVDHPNNTNAFLQVLVHLHRVGFPPHWISDFFNLVVSNGLVTRAKPYVGLTPVPMSESTNLTSAPRKVNLEPWQAELEVILALTAPALPFAVSMPQDFAALADIRTFTTTVESLPLYMQTLAYISGPMLDGYIKALGLMFYKPNTSVSWCWSRAKAKDEADYLVRNIASMLEDKCDTEVQFTLTLMPEGDPSKGEISWQMSRRWFEKMKTDGWCMVVYRTDLHGVATFPVAADKWSEV